MKIVLRHRISGRYYSSAGDWVRRADNALAFDDLDVACEFSRVNHLDEVQPVHRLAPYVMALLQAPAPTFWEEWSRRVACWNFETRARFYRN